MWFYGKAQERKERLETTSQSLERNKALKSEAYERWELKEIPKGREANKNPAEWVAKPRRGASEKQGNVFQTLPGNGKWRKRAFRSEYAERPRILCEVRFEVGLVDRDQR